MGHSLVLVIKSKYNAQETKLFNSSAVIAALGLKVQRIQTRGSAFVLLL